ncbi:hypothetical protein LZ30DRAFT_742486 [Colletotrichum cereale]|nr:hypothetical protein LZ30DRAFT_742486 [Colletotrichum cereale]
MRCCRCYPPLPLLSPPVFRLLVWLTDAHRTCSFFVSRACPSTRLPACLCLSRCGRSSCSCSCFLLHPPAVPAVPKLLAGSHFPTLRHTLRPYQRCVTLSPLARNLCFPVQQLCPATKA